MTTTTADDVLAKLGLQARLSPRDYLLPALGIFGLGLFVGSGMTLMLAPQARQRLRQRFERGAFKVKQAVGAEGSSIVGDLEQLSREDLYERARTMNIETHPNMSKSDLVHAIAGS